MTTGTRKRLGKAVRRFRKARGLSLVELAGKIGGCPSGISRIERGKQEPREGTIARLAEALGVSPKTLLPG